MAEAPIIVTRTIMFITAYTSSFMPIKHVKLVSMQMKGALLLTYDLCFQLELDFYQLKEFSTTQRLSNICFPKLSEMCKKQC